MKSFDLFRSIGLASRHLSGSRRKLQTVPYVIDNDGRGERMYDIYSRLLKDRIVCVMSPVIHSWYLHCYRR